MRWVKRLLKLLLGLLVLVLVLLVLAWAFHPPLVKWAVAKYSPEYTGRQITVEHFRLNPFTGSARVEGLKVLEAAGDTVFVNVGEIYVDLAVMALFAGRYEVEQVSVTHPFARIIQRGDRFNFTDLIERFASDSGAAEPPAPEPVRWAVRDLRVDSCSIDYLSDLLDMPLRIVRLDASCPGMAWDQDRIDATVDLALSHGTTLKSELTYAQAAGLYEVRATLAKTPVHWLRPYVLPFLSIGDLEGMMGTTLHVKGSVSDPMAVALSGRVDLDGFSMADPKGVKLVGLKKLDLVIDTVDVKKEIYHVQRFTVDQPYAFFELYDDGDNFTRLLPPDSVSATEEELGYDPMNPFSMLAYYVRMIAENVGQANYKVDSLGMADGTVLFNDYTLYETFKYELGDVDVSADGINSAMDSITFHAHASLNRTGTFDAKLDLDPYSIRNLHLQYTIDRMGMSDLGPYAVFFVAHPILDGHTRYVCNTTVMDNKLHSENKILVTDFEFGRKMDIKDAMDLPMRFAVSLLKDKNGDIKLDLPVEGDLDDPEYKVWPVIWQVLKNLVIKAVSAPYNMLARAFDADEEDLRSVRYLHLQEEVTKIQEKPLNILSRVVSDKPDMHIELVRSGDRAAEAEAYALLKAKADFLADSTHAQLPTTTKELEPLVRDLNVRSPGFTAWLNGKLGGAGADEPVQKRCLRHVGVESANAEVGRLWASRSAGVQAYLTTERKLSPTAFTIRDLTPQDTLTNTVQPAFQVIYSAADPGGAPAP